MKGLNINFEYILFVTLIIIRLAHLRLFCQTQQDFKHYIILHLFVVILKANFKPQSLLPKQLLKTTLPL